MVRSLPMFGQIWPMFGQCLANFGPHCPTKGCPELPGASGAFQGASGGLPGAFQAPCKGGSKRFHALPTGRPRGFPSALQWLPRPSKGFQGASKGFHGASDTFQGLPRPFKGFQIRPEIADFSCGGPARYKAVPKNNTLFFCHFVVGPFRKRPGLLPLFCCAGCRGRDLETTQPRR